MAPLGAVRPRRILLVEEGRRLAEATDASLTMAGFGVSWAASVAAALAALATNPVDVVVTDFELPDGRATTVVSEAHEQGIPVVAATGRAESRLAGS